MRKHGRAEKWIIKLDRDFSQRRPKLGSRNSLPVKMKANGITDFWKGPLEDNAPRQPLLALCRLATTL